MKPVMRPIPLKEVEITDALFGRYAALVAKKSVPYQWKALNDQLSDDLKSHCMDNFRIAAGEMKGRHRGAIFQDTDLYKWLEAVAFCIENGSGAEFEADADGAIALLERAQGEDGYLNTYISIEHPDRRWSNLTEGHELYAAGHLIEAAVAYQRATDKRALLDVAIRFADLIDAVFGPETGKREGCPGHQEIELALVKLYRATGEQRYLNLADHFIARRGDRPNFFLAEMRRRGGFGFELFPEFNEYDEQYAQSHLPPVEQTTAEGHAVRALYMYSAMADLALEKDDQALLKACEALYRNIVERRMYITGGVGSSGKLERFTVDYDLPNDTMYCESCASIALMMFAQRMAALTGEAGYYDTVERALCNTVLAGIAVTGERYFYVNPLQVWPDNCIASTSMSHVKPVRQPWFACSCCPPNIARTLAGLGQYVYAAGDGAIYVNQLISSRLRHATPGGEIRLEMRSNYMKDGAVLLDVELPEAHRVALMVRVPAYMACVEFTLDGAALWPDMANGYARIELSGAGGHKVVMNGRVEAGFVAANRNVRADVGRLALMKGPFVYCLEQADNGENLASLSVRPETPVGEAPPLTGMPGELPTLSLEGERITSTLDDPDALYGAPRYAYERARLRAVPYCLWCNREPGEMQVWIRAR